MNMPGSIDDNEFALYDDERGDYAQRSTRDEDEEKLHKQKMKIIQRLLKRFNMEECMEHYRSLNTVEHKVDPKELSLDSEMSGIKVKSHLEALMGTDIVKLNDRQYMLALQDRLIKEHESTVSKQEEMRSEKERKRQRRLYIEGLQDLPNIDQRTKQADRASRGKTAMPALSRSKAHHAEAVEEDDTYMSRVGKRNPQTPKLYNQETSRSKPGSTNHSPNATESGSSGSQSSSEKVEIERRISEKDESDFDLSKRAQLMRQLKREKTVTGLYTTAAAVLAAPVAELKDAVEPAKGSPRGSEDPDAAGLAPARPISGLALMSNGEFINKSGVGSPGEPSKKSEQPKSTE